jgi:hypothetical protein
LENPMMVEPMRREILRGRSITKTIGVARERSVHAALRSISRK